MMRIVILNDIQLQVRKLVEARNESIRWETDQLVFKIERIKNDGTKIITQ